MVLKLPQHGRKGGRTLILSSQFCISCSEYQQPPGGTCEKSRIQKIHQGPELLSPSTGTRQAVLFSHWLSTNSIGMALGLTWKVLPVLIFSGSHGPTHLIEGLVSPGIPRWLLAPVFQMITPVRLVPVWPLPFGIV